MIGKLKGTLDEIGEDHCTVDVHGVGYVALLLGAHAGASARSGRGGDAASSRPMCART